LAQLQFDDCAELCFEDVACVAQCDIIMLQALQNCPCGTNCL